MFFQTKGLLIRRFFVILSAISANHKLIVK